MHAMHEHDIPYPLKATAMMGQTVYFEYSTAEIDYLRAADPQLGAVIDRVGHIERPVIPDSFEALVHSIVGQQIATKAQATIWERMRTSLAPIAPAHFVSLPVRTIQACGITMLKAQRIHDIAARIESGGFRLEEIRRMDDETACEHLMTLPGVGRWTAEMILLFSLQRPDVLSATDLGIQRGLRMVHHHRRITPQLFARYRRRYSPCNSVASLYLWEIAGGALDDLRDPAEHR